MNTQEIRRKPSGGFFAMLAAAILAAIALLPGCSSDDPGPVTPQQTFGAYVLEYGGAITGYAVDSATGLPSKLPGSPFATAGQAWDIAASPGGPFLYTTGQVERSVSAHRVAGDRALSDIPSGVGDMGNPSLEIAFSQDGRFMYVSVNTSGGGDGLHAFEIGEDGGLTSIGNYSTGRFPRSIVISPDGAYLFIANRGSSANSGEIHGYGIAADGRLTWLDYYAAGSYTEGLAISPDGAYLYASNNGAADGVAGISGYSVAENGDLAPIGTFDTGPSPKNIAISADGACLYATNFGSADGTGGLTAYQIGADGSLSEIDSYDTAPKPRALAISPCGKFLYAIGNVNTGVGALGAYRIASGGGLDSIGFFDTGANAVSIAVTK
jgi:6-phosphogluconolactonase (cycloisomerase 2 family)